MFTSLLIANRGEIAVRIIRTARRLGIETIAVYSDADRGAAHVDAADKSVHIGPPPANASYLDVKAILRAAKVVGADAIHPGYGFLSENADFAQACAGAGLVFVGPPPAAIRAMGLKDRAKILMQEAGVAVVPGYLGAKQDAAHLATEAEKLGYPLLIKPVAGGGGKGMHRVDAALEFQPALEAAKREAKSAFGDDRVLLEKYIQRPRHIEMQIFADAHGNTIHLFERDCSLQRRHQKVIEEAPAPGMTASMRTAMGEAATRAARAVGYVGAGTVEFIADASQGLKKDRFWFLEMNTRLQVEHPVTEAITGLDLVEWQLRVAAGETLPKKQDEVHIHGHAIEARIYAEDPQHDFLPSVGKLERLRFSETVRVDAGVREGDAVSVYYDPMIAKVIAHGKTRDAAIEKLASALCETEIAGVRSNNAFLIRTLREADFRHGDVDTGFFEQHRSTIVPAGASLPPSVLAAAARFVVGEEGNQSRRNSSDPWNTLDRFRLGGPARWSVEFNADGKRISVNEPTSPENGPAYPVLRLASGELAVIACGETHLLREYDPLALAEAAGRADERVIVPMPGKITRVLVKAGDHVTRGQPLAVLEAMKMEHTLAAPGDAEIDSVDVAPGDQVSEGAVIVRFKKAEDSA